MLPLLNNYESKFYFCTLASNPSIISSPQSLNVTVDQGRTSMSCKAYAEALEFIVDEQESSKFSSMGFIQEDPMFQEGELRRMLVIDVRKKMAGNTFKIYCRSFNFSNSTLVYSKTALFMVAGMLNVLSI